MLVQNLVGMTSINVICDISVWNEWIKGHKDVAGLRNKPFPHYDELGIIFGKDRATREVAEAPGDAMENIQDEEATEKAASEAYGAMNNGENYDDFFDVNLENVSKSILFTKTGNSESSPSMEKRPTVQGAKEEIGKLASCFQQLANNAKRKMQVYDVIAMIEGLNDKDTLKVVAIMFIDTDKTNVLFSIPDCMKKLYVQQLLNGTM
ncbi:hypothetical protein PTKIN_Ptkin17bG0052500 [Pterospermum kingtungense]